MSSENALPLLTPTATFRFTWKEIKALSLAGLEARIEEILAGTTDIRFSYPLYGPQVARDLALSAQRYLVHADTGPEDLRATRTGAAYHSLLLAEKALARHEALERLASGEAVDVDAAVDAVYR